MHSILYFRAKSGSVSPLRGESHEATSAIRGASRRADRVQRSMVDSFRMASNGGTPVGQPFVVDGVVHENFTALALQMNDATFLGKGFLVSAPMFAIPGLGR